MSLVSRSDKMDGSIIGILTLILCVYWFVKDVLKPGDRKNGKPQYDDHIDDGGGFDSD